MNWAERKTFGDNRPVRFLHVSSEIVQLPIFGTNPEVDRAVLAGQYRDIQQVFLPDGTEVHIARTKGVTYRKPKA